MLANPNDKVYNLLTLINDSVSRLISKHILDTYVQEVWITESQKTQNMHVYSNQVRQQRWLAPLSRNGKLDNAAEMMANDMAQYDFFIHESPLWIGYIHRMDALWYDRTHASENLGQGNVKASYIVDLRTESPVHEKNLYSTDATQVWYGFDPVENYRVAVYWSQQ